MDLGWKSHSFGVEVVMFGRSSAAVQFAELRRNGYHELKQMCWRLEIRPVKRKAGIEVSF